ncbi:MAG: carbamoyl-phosphate synthase (glutamine-hydrolyzing) large subunit [Parachlamydiaceae bacterium]
MSSPRDTPINDNKPSDTSDGFFFAQMIRETAFQDDQSIQNLSTSPAVSKMTPSSLLLENGTVFKGMSPDWQDGRFDGEVVFTTGMTGYDASLTDPSYAGQILVFTYPLLGNYGVTTPDNWESERIHAAGVVLCTLCDQWSHGKSVQSLLQWLKNENVPVITGVDTRELTKVLREAGTMRGSITSGDHLFQPIDLASPKVTVPEKIVYGDSGKRIILVDCGMKTNILRHLKKFPVTIERVPYDYDYSNEEFDGVFLSNGPGDPASYVETIAVLRRAMKKDKPIFGICLGMQLLALAAGATSYKLAYGHRGHNQPCIEIETKRCFVTSQNHGYAVLEDTLPPEWKVTFKNLNDNTVEGISHTSLPFFAVQFHPEAAPGPTDTEWLFQRFAAMLGIKSGQDAPRKNCGQTYEHTILCSGSKILILGSGGLCIGQAGEFDYSGSQAIKALKEEGMITVLINPNIATVQTDEGLADHVYLEPLNLETATRIIEKEKPDGILLGFGGQTALNLGMALDDAGVLKRFGVKVLGTSVDTIRISEDRLLFKDTLHSIGVDTPHSFAAKSVEEALQASRKIGFPLMMRSGFSLGGLGSGKIADEKELIFRAAEALSNAPQILIEEYLEGWKEIEYEVVRDAADNAITVCNMENLDPMGIHTGESIVVAPSQTLTNQEFHMLREVALKTIRHLGVIGECNIQYALHPFSGEYRVIEVNARLSRSSALASKATGYPLAFIAAKISLGKLLHELKNQVTRQTSAFFEPALDYIVVKMPRWDTQKFKAANRTIGSEMKSVGEVMAVGRSFPEALQKAVRMLNIGSNGLSDYPQTIPNPINEIIQSRATDRRLFAIYQYFKQGGAVEEVHRVSKIDPWFLYHIDTIAKIETSIAEAPALTAEILLLAKKNGFSDSTVARLRTTTEDVIRATRLTHGIRPYVKQIDTLAGEFAAQTNYLYLTYHGSADDVPPSEAPAIAVLGSGPYCIGSSVEFDWCAVNALKSLRKMGEKTVMINSNPETVSTDYDESDRLYFEELTLERVSDIADFEKLKGIVVCVGGQIANNLVIPLARRGYPILGTPVDGIDTAEDREKFSSLLNQLNIDQPAWEKALNISQAKAFAKRVGYPVLVRPSYVLSGAAMNVIYSDHDLDRFLKEAAVCSNGHPVVLSKFIEHSKELEIDGIAQDGKIIVQAISEHIENAGVHSGDATIVIPPQRIYLGTIRQAKNIARDIVKALKITGPFNIQFLAKDNLVKVIECNARASRSFPFVSKVIHHNLIDTAVKAILGKPIPLAKDTLELNYVGVKTSQFSFSRLKGANPVAQVEMASTGEVGCLGDTFHEAFYRSWMATGQKILGKRLLLSIGGDKKIRLLPLVQKLEADGWELYATEGTHDFLAAHGIASRILYKIIEKLSPNIKETLTSKQVDLIINIPTSDRASSMTDGFTIRRMAIDHQIPLITNLQIAQLFMLCLCEVNLNESPIKPWKEYVTHEL